MKLHIGHGGHILEGWDNLERNQCDITKPIALFDNSVDFILLEHVLEHVTPQEGYRFLQEAFRLLKPKGVLRVIVPEIVKLWWKCNDEYLAMLKAGIADWYREAGMNAPAEVTKKEAVESLIFCHGHQALYTTDLLLVLFRNVGFSAFPSQYGWSIHPELRQVDSHWKYMGFANCVLESIVVEGQKP